MKEIIEQFVSKLNEDGILSEDQIKEFESFGSQIQSHIQEKVEAEKEESLSEAKKEAELKISESEAHHEEELRKIEEAFDSVVEKMSEVKAKEIKLALYNYRNNETLTFKEEKVVEGIDKYLSAVVEEHLPEQPVVDYAKLDRLEKTFESMRDTLLISSDEVQSKVDSILEDVQEELAQKSDMLNEAFESELEKIHSEEFEGEETETATIVKEEVVQEQSELDMYAQLAERFLPKK